MTAFYDRINLLLDEAIDAFVAGLAAHTPASRTHPVAWAVIQAVIGVTQVTATGAAGIVTIWLTFAVLVGRGGAAALLFAWIGLVAYVTLAQAAHRTIRRTQRHTRAVASAFTSASRP